MKLLTTSLLAAATLCQAQSLTDLGTLTGGSYSEARGVSANGNVVVGSSISTNGDRAFRWTNNVMTDLGTLPGGTSSDASGVSADGNVVVGSSSSTNGGRAFRWTNNVMTDLGTLTGGAYSFASGVSADGNVVVGDSYSTNGPGPGVSTAFRWTNNVMTDLGTLTGGSYSQASGVSANGNVVVGSSGSTNGERAFRWTNNVMTDLGTLTGGSNSQAKGVSADGNVVVGDSGDRAFRWTNNVMTDLGTLPGGTSSFARGVSADGNVVVGGSTSTNGTRAFLYRNSVMLDVQDWLGSVGGVCSMLSTSLDLSRAHLEGAHHRPLAELGRGRSYWTTGDVASSSRSRDLITRSGEAGVTFEPWTNVLVGVGAGYGRQDQQLLNDGSASTFGQYLIGEVDLIQADGGIFSVIVSVGDWKNETDRGYVTGAGVDFSHGETSLASKAFRLRYDSPVLVKTLGTDVKAYVSYGHSKVRSDAYVETGGSNAGSFGAMEQTAKEGRLGVAATRSFGEKFRGRLSAEWIRRFDRDQASITATDLTSTLDLTLPGTAVVRDQARFGFDLDYLMDAKTTLSFTVHAAGRGESADVSGAISLRKAF
jgi:probable HAF family extracellular repeat protein